MRIVRLQTSDGVVTAAQTSHGFQRILGDPASPLAVDPAAAELGHVVEGEVLAPVVPGPAPTLPGFGRSGSRAPRAG